MMKKGFDLRLSCLCSLLVIVLNVNVAESKWCISQLVIVADSNGTPMPLPGGGFNPYVVNSVMYLEAGDTSWLMFWNCGEDCDTNITNHPLLLRNGLIVDSLETTSSGFGCPNFVFMMTDTGHYSIGYWENLGNGQLEITIVHYFDVRFSICPNMGLVASTQIVYSSGILQSGALLFLESGDTILFNYQYEWGNNSYLQLDTCYLYRNGILVGTYIDSTPCSGQAILFAVYDDGFYEFRCKNYDPNYNSNAINGLYLLKCFSVYQSNSVCYSGPQSSFCETVNSLGTNINNTSIWLYPSIELHFDLFFYYGPTSNYMLDTIFIYKNNLLVEMIPVDSPCDNLTMPLTFNAPGNYQLMYRQCESYFTFANYFWPFCSFTIMESTSPCPTSVSSSSHNFSSANVLQLPTYSEHWILPGDTFLLDYSYQWGNAGCYQYDTLYIYKDGALFQTLIDPTPCETNEISFYLTEQGYYQFRVNNICMQNTLSSIGSCHLYFSASPCTTTNNSYGVWIESADGDTATNGTVFWLPANEEILFSYNYEWTFECCLQLDSAELFRDNILLAHLYDSTPCSSFQIPFLIDAPGNYFILIPDKCYSSFDTIFQIEILQSASPCFTTNQQCNFSVEALGYSTFPNLIEITVNDTADLAYNYAWGNECNWTMDELVLYKDGMFYNQYSDITPCETNTIPFSLWQQGNYQGYLFSNTAAVFLSPIFSIIVDDTTNDSTIIDLFEANNAGTVSAISNYWKNDFIQHVSVRQNVEINFSIDATKEPVNYFITNILGQKLELFDPIQDQIKAERLDISDWTSGIYLIIAIGENDSDVEKFHIR